MAFAKKNILTTALGTATGFVNIHKADFKYNDRGIYKVALTIPNSDPRCQAMIDDIVALHEADYAARLEEHAKNPPKVVPGKKPIKPFVGEMPFCDNEDGTTTFTFKGYASFLKDGVTKPIELRVVDSRGKTIQDVPVIGSGSKLKIKYSMVPYGWTKVAGASVKLQLEGVMLVELATFGAGGDDWGDEAEEGGYTASESRGNPPAGTPEDYGQQEGDDEDSDDSGDF